MERFVHCLECPGRCNRLTSILLNEKVLKENSTEADIVATTSLVLASDSPEWNLLKRKKKVSKAELEALTLFFSIPSLHRRPRTTFGVVGGFGIHKKPGLAGAVQGWLALHKTLRGNDGRGHLTPTDRACCSWHMPTGLRDGGRVAVSAELGEGGMTSSISQLSQFLLPCQRCVSHLS